MPIEYGNVFSSQGNPLRSILGRKAAGGPLRMLQPLGGFDGAAIVRGSDALLDKQAWKFDLNSGSWAAVANNLPPEMLLTNAAAAHSTVQGQLSYDGGTTVWAPFKPATGLVIAAGLSLKVSEITTKTLLLGFTEAGADRITVTTGALAATDHVGFYSATGAATMVGAVRTSSTSTSTGTLHTLVAGTYVDLAIVINETKSVEFWVNGVRTLQTTMTNIPTTGLTFTLAYSGNAKTLTLKRPWLYASGVA